MERREGGRKRGRNGEEGGREEEREEGEKEEGMQREGGRKNKREEVREKKEREEREGEREKREEGRKGGRGRKRGGGVRWDRNICTQSGQDLTCGVALWSKVSLFSHFTFVTLWS